MSSDKLTDPTQWDSDFINTVLEGQANYIDIDQAIGYVETAQAFIDPAIFAEAGISELSDLTGDNINSLVTGIITSTPGLEGIINDALGGFWNVKYSLYKQYL